MQKIARLSIVLIVLFVLILPGSVHASPAFDSTAITVSPASAAPGGWVQIKGQGFSTSGVARVHWDLGDPNSPVLAQASISPDGTTVINIAIPPSASAGVHTLWLVNQLRAGGTESASAAITVAAPNRKAAYIYGTDSTTGDAFKALLDANGVQTTLVQLSGITQNTNFSPYDLIIVGQDTGISGTWGNAENLLGLKKSGRPVLGIGDGGYAFFGKYSSPIGYPDAAHGSTNSVRVTNLSDPLYHTPVNIPVSNNIIQVLSASVDTVQIYLPQPDSRTYNFGQPPAEFGLLQPRPIRAVLVMGVQCSPCSTDRRWAEPVDQHRLVPGWTAGGRHTGIDQLHPHAEYWIYPRRCHQSIKIKSMNWSVCLPAPPT